ncbi:MAG: N-formylglutamate amidohydrolase [Myxococcales bacterium]|nr:MAG: N-formylglutamate amidohydrolase [Myxococcales bacterium]
MRHPVELVGDPAAGGPFVFTCEHASNELPEWQPEATERATLAAHWGWDIGAADLTRALAKQTGSCAVLSRFSRLVCDPNRDPSERSFVVDAIDGVPLSWNRAVDAAERDRREARYFAPYHEAIDHTLSIRRAVGTELRLCSIHSFTPVYLGLARPMEVGVLFDTWDEHAWRLEGALAAEGFAAVLNAPYSGRDGLIYAAKRHGCAHGLVYLELEVRQDLIDAPARAVEIASRIARALEVFRPATGINAP